MLTINDLHSEQELSSFEMGKVAGGNVISNILQIAASKRSPEPSGYPLGYPDTEYYGDSTDDNEGYIDDPIPY